MGEVEERWRRGFRGGQRQACEGGGAGGTLGEAGQLQSVAASGEAKAGAALHGGEAKLRVPDTALDASSTMAPPLLHRCPQARALRAPGGTATQLVRARQGSALAFAGRSGGLQAFFQAKILQQAGDCAGGGAHVPIPVRGTFMRLRQDIP